MLGCTPIMGRQNKKKKTPLSLYTRVRVESCWGVMLGCTPIMGRQNKEKKNHFLCTRGLGLNHAVPTSMHTPAFNWWLKQVELLHTPACQHQCSHQLFLPFCPRHQPLNLSSVSSSMTAGHFKEIRRLATALE